MTTITHITTEYVIPPIKKMGRGAILGAAYGLYNNISLVSSIKAGSACGLCVYVFGKTSLLFAKKLLTLAQERNWKASTVLSLEMTRIAFQTVAYTTGLLALGIISKNCCHIAFASELMLYSFGLGYALSIRQSQNDAALSKRFSYHDWYAGFQMVRAPA